MTHRIVLEVDGGKLFDTLRNNGGDLSDITFRLSMPLMTGQMPNAIDAIGLAYHGVTVVGVDAKAKADVKATAVRVYDEMANAGERLSIYELMERAILADRATLPAEGCDSVAAASSSLPEAERTAEAYPSTGSAENG